MSPGCDAARPASSHVGRRITSRARDWSPAGPCFELALRAASRKSQPRSAPSRSTCSPQSSIAGDGHVAEGGDLAWKARAGRLGWLVPNCLKAANLPGVEEVAAWPGRDSDIRVTVSNVWLPCTGVLCEPCPRRRWEISYQKQW